MGLAIEIGMLAYLNKNHEDADEYRKTLAQLNAVLVKNGYPEHREPEHFEHQPSRAGVRGFPYSCLHYLRRFAAYASTKPGWRPVPFPEDEEPTEDRVLDDVLSSSSSHLICHSDCQGFYVPIDFDSPIYSEDEDDLEGGGIVGSSQGLMRELVAVAPYLGIKLVGGELSDAEAARVNAEVLAEVSPFSTEMMAWIALFEAARLSIQHRTVIHFG